MGIFQWLNDQLLKMQWLSDLVGILVRDVFGLDLASRVGGSIHFFIYDVIKIFIRLSVLIFSISYVQSFFPPERTKKILGRFDGITANILAALLGTITPFCSCSSIPLFIGFTGSGLPLGVTFSFLISSPLVDLGIDYPLGQHLQLEDCHRLCCCGIDPLRLSAELMGKRTWRTRSNLVFGSPTIELEEAELTRRDRVDYAVDQVKEVVQKVRVFYVLLGVGIGAAIHN